MRKKLIISTISLSILGPLNTLFIVLIVCGFLSNSYAQPGTLDNTFGVSGKSMTSIDSIGDWAYSVAIQSDEKIVVGGFTQSNFAGSDFALVRYNNNGSLDTTFGSGGIVVTPIELRSKAYAIAIQDDGKILLGGGSDWFINVARYNNDGTLDATFGTNGIVITDIPGYYSEKCKSLAIQSDGKILVGGDGKHSNNDNPHFILARYDSSGILDSTFGAGGIAIGNNGTANSMSLQTDGRIVLGGATNYMFALERYNSNGTLDSNFGTNGYVSTQVGVSGEGKSVIVKNDGKIILAGYSYGTSAVSDYAMVQYNSDGSVDNTFGLGGIVITNIGTASSSGESLILQSDGKIVLSGNASNGNNSSNFAIARYNLDGTLDVNFGVAGRVITEIGSSYSVNNAMTLDDDGKMVLVGYSYNGSKIDFTVARFNDDDGLEIGEDCGEKWSSKVYPNPFSSSATIQLNTTLQNAELVVFTIYGEEVDRIANISGKEIQMSRDNLKNGVYYLELIEDNKIISINKVIISEK